MTKSQSQYWSEKSQFDYFPKLFSPTLGWESNDLASRLPCLRTHIGGRPRPQLTGAHARGSVTDVKITLKAKIMVSHYDNH